MGPERGAAGLGPGVPSREFPAAADDSCGRDGGGFSPGQVHPPSPNPARSLTHADLRRSGGEPARTELDLGDSRGSRVTRG